MSQPKLNGKAAPRREPPESPYDAIPIRLHCNGRGTGPCPEGLAIVVPIAGETFARPAALARALAEAGFTLVTGHWGADPARPVGVCFDVACPACARAIQSMTVIPSAPAPREGSVEASLEAALKGKTRA